MYVKLISKQNEKFIYQMHVHSSWNTQVMEDNV